MARTPDNQLFEQARAHLEAKQWPKAERALKKLAKTHPGNPLIHQQLGIVLQKQGKGTRAVDSFKKAIAADQDDPNLHMLLAYALQEIGRFEEAKMSASASIERAPADASLHQRHGLLFMRLGLPHEAHQELEKAHELEPDDIGILAALVDGIIARNELPMDTARAHRLVELQPYEARNHARLGTILRMNDQLDDAIGAYDAALAIDRFDSDARAGKAEILVSRGRPEDAVELLRPLVNAPSCRYLPMLAWMRTCARLGDPEAAILAGERWLAAEPRSPSQSSTMFHRLALSYDKLDRRPEAFESWRRGNAIHAGQWNASEHSTATDDLIKSFSADAMRRLPRSANTSSTPLFIVGMFRSGTTLTEQVISAHPQAHGAGELSALFELIQSLPGELGDESYPGCIEHLTSSRLDDMASRYLEALSADAGAATRITDKLPLNYLNIGLISLLFPEARIIHCMRDPLDTCFSCWGNSFSARMAFTADFKTLGQTYVDYVRLMDHWKQVEGVPILDVQYERLVQEPESVAREIIEFIGLDWDPACLRHHESSRVARTLSMDQVSAPMSTSSIGRSRPYWEELAPLRNALGELAPDDPES